MAAGTVAEAARAMEGQLLSGDPSARWHGAVLDSRQVTGGELFFALPGASTDGHRWAADALARGAAAAVVHREVEAAGTLVRVEDSFQALHALTRAVRERLPERLVAVTGSVGKTTTKELLAAMLGARFRVARSPGNLNNLYGFPVALLGVDEDCEWMVAEMGMSEPGELKRISLLGRPDVAVFTNVRPVHLEYFGSLEAIAAAKGELLAGLAPGGLVVANADDPLVMRITESHHDHRVTFGLAQPAESTARDVEPLSTTSGSAFVWRVEGRDHRVRLPLHGAYNVTNFLAAATCAHAVGVSPDEIVAAVAAVEPSWGRGRVRRLPSGAVVVDDVYNSNPEALQAALESAARIEGTRHWAVLGDMLELGEEAAAFHRRAGRLAADLDFEPVIGVGALARELIDGAAAAGAATGWYPDAATAAGELPAPRSGDVVLVKGSRGVGLEAVVDALTGEEGG